MHWTLDSNAPDISPVLAIPVSPKCLACLHSWPGSGVCGTHGGRTATMHVWPLTTVNTLFDKPDIRANKEVSLLSLVFEHPPPCAKFLSRCVVSETIGVLEYRVSSELNGDVSTGHGDHRGYPQLGIDSVLTANIETPSCQWNAVWS